MLEEARWRRPRRCSSPISPVTSRSRPARTRAWSPPASAASVSTQPRPRRAPDVRRRSESRRLTAAWTALTAGRDAAPTWPSAWQFRAPNTSPKSSADKVRCFQRRIYACLSYSTEHGPPHEGGPARIPFFWPYLGLLTNSDRNLNRTLIDADGLPHPLILALADTP